MPCDYSYHPENAPKKMTQTEFITHHVRQGKTRGEAQALWEAENAPKLGEDPNTFNEPARPERRPEPPHFGMSA